MQLENGLFQNCLINTKCESDNCDCTATLKLLLYHNMIPSLHTIKHWFLRQNFINVLFTKFCDIEWSTGGIFHVASITSVSGAHRPRVSATVRRVSDRKQFPRRHNTHLGFPKRSVIGSAGLERCRLTHTHIHLCITLMYRFLSGVITMRQRAGAAGLPEKIA